jgi:hypothetical protein
MEVDNDITLIGWIKEAQGDGNDREARRVEATVE